ncbi:hypothetical protein WBJ53_17815 [Spirosoma sp. SC4-14]|uniref:hypothetical protein n=1 Tax=Spirosoma sp. SC4-14 TaxID=3128900 RepID=UPI0030CEBD3C
METILCMGLVIGSLWLSIHLAGKRQKRGKALYKAYQTAIATGTKAQAMSCGQAFYKFSRNGNLTLNDELSIKKDISSMP